MMRKVFRQTHRLMTHIGDSLRKSQLRRTRREVETILAKSENPFFCDDEIFDDLQYSYPPRPEYGYDAVSCWRRGVHRVLSLLDWQDLRPRGLAALEAACGDGMTGFALANYGYHVTLTDREDWRDSRARSLMFVVSDLCRGVPLSSDTFDFVCSYNSFEHFADPVRGLNELVRVSKPGGLIYLEFGPLYASPWGLHAYRTIRAPYVQFLFRPKLLTEKFRELGIHDLGRDQATLQPLNRWTPRDFADLWKKSGCDVLREEKFEDYEHLALVKQYPYAFWGQNLQFEDLTTQALYVMLRKPHYPERDGRADLTE